MPACSATRWRHWSPAGANSEVHLALSPGARVLRNRKIRVGLGKEPSRTGVFQPASGARRKGTSLLQTSAPGFFAGFERRRLVRSGKGGWLASRRSCLREVAEKSQTFANFNWPSGGSFRRPRQTRAQAPPPKSRGNQSLEPLEFKKTSGIGEPTVRDRCPEGGPTCSFETTPVSVIVNPLVGPRLDFFGRLGNAKRSLRTRSFENHRLARPLYLFEVWFLGPTSLDSINLILLDYLKTKACPSRRLEEEVRGHVRRGRGELPAIRRVPHLGARRVWYLNGTSCRIPGSRIDYLADVRYVMAAPADGSAVYKPLCREYGTSSARRGKRRKGKAGDNRKAKKT